MKNKAKINAACKGGIFFISIMPCYTYLNMQPDLILELCNILLSFAAILMLIYMFQKFADTPFGVTLVYFLSGTLFLSAIALFTILTDLNYLKISRETFVIWNHGLFYASMATFWFGSKNMIKLLETKQSAPMLMGIALFSGGGVFVLILTSFFIVKSLDPLITKFFSGWLWTSFGLQHFIAFIMAALASYYLFKIQKTLNPQKNALMAPFVLVFVLFSGIHLWELLFENWEVLKLSSETIEIVERVLTVLAFIALILVFQKIISLLSEEKTQDAIPAA